MDIDVQLLQPFSFMPLDPLPRAIAPAPDLRVIEILNDLEKGNKKLRIKVIHMMVNRRFYFIS